VNLSLPINGYTATATTSYNGSSPVTDSSGNVTLWLLPNDSGYPNHLYSFTATPPNGSIYSSFALNNISVTEDQTELISLQYNHDTPVTTADLAIQNPDETYSDPTTVTLTASAAAGYTVANTYYKVDGGSQQTYTDPFTVTGNGEHTIEYWSVDNSGVTESHSTKTFTIHSTYTLSGAVYIDTNENGVQDSGESGYNGATHTLNSGQTATTDGNGSYEIPDLPTGTYTETLTVPNDYVATTTNPVSVLITSDTTANFGIINATTTLTPIADSFIKEGSQNENEGGSSLLRIQSSGHNRALVKFDQSQIQQAVGNSQNYTATLQFTISDNGNNWGATGRTIDLDRLTQNWAEGNGFIARNTPPYRGTGLGLTWNCATDSNIANQNDDCSGNSAWNMSNSSLWPFESTPTATATIINNQAGTVTFTVTSDIQSFISNINQNYGWLVKKTNESQTGQVSFSSKEGATSPKLIIIRN
ncbi:MAG: SdrD B-like domain-containing protein, partial [Patescibacteria group bacterium]